MATKGKKVEIYYTSKGTTTGIDASALIFDGKNLAIHTHGKVFKGTDTTYSANSASGLSLSGSHQFSLNVGTKDSTNVSAAATYTADRFYQIVPDKNNKLGVVVPWEDHNDDTWLPLTTSQAGYVPKASGGVDSSNSNTYYFLGYTGSSINWFKLPANAFENSTYTVNNASFTIFGNGTSVVSTSANADDDSSINIVAGDNVTVTADADNKTIEIAAIDTWKAVSKTVDGYVPKIGSAAASTISAQANEWVLTSTKGGTPSWRKLPANAFKNDTYTVNDGTFTIFGNGTSVASTSANAGDDSSVNIVGGTNVTVTPDAANKKITIDAASYTNGAGLTLSDHEFSLATSGVSAGTYKRVTVDKYGRVTAGDNTDANDDTWRKVQLDGVDKLGSATTTKPLNIKAGSNMSIAESNGAFTFNSTDTWNALSSSQAGYVPKASGGVDSQDTSTYYFLGYTGSSVNWFKLPANAFENDTYTVNNGKYSIKSLVGSTTTTLSDFTANQSGNDDFTLVQGSNITFTNDATNRKLTIAGTADTKVTAVGNHYDPTADANEELTASLSGTAGAYDINTEYTVLTGVKAQRDAKGHVTGLTYTAQKVKDTNTNTAQLQISDTTNRKINTSESTGKYIQFTGGTNKITVTDGTSSFDVSVTPYISNNVTGSGLTADKIVLGNGSSTLKTSSKGIVTTLGNDDTTVPTSKAVQSAISNATAGLTGAMHFIGTSTTAITDGGTENPTISGYSGTAKTAGNVLLYNGKEYIWTGSAWELFGDEGSYALKTIKVEGDGVLGGGGTLESNRKITHNTSGVDASTYGPNDNVTGSEGATIKVPQITVDSYGHVTAVTERTYTSKNSTYTVNNGTYSIKSKVGDTTTTVSDFTANQEDADDFTIIQGSNITLTPDATNRTLTIAGKAGTVTKVSTGIGLTGGDITTTGTIKAKLKNETKNSADSTKSTSTDGGLYSIEADKSGNLAVRVPWTDTDTKVTSVDNHYAPSANNDSSLNSTVSSTENYALGTEYSVVTGINIQRDAKGHVTGVTTTNQKVKDTNTWQLGSSSQVGYVPKATAGKYLHSNATTGALEWVDDRYAANSDRYVNSAVFADDTTNNASSPVKMTLTRAGSDTATVTANLPKVSSSSAGVAPKGAAVSSQSQSTKFLREDGSWAAPSYTTNTDKTGVKKGTAGATATADNTLISVNSSSGIIFEGGTNQFKVGNGTNSITIGVAHGLVTKNMSVNGTNYALYTSATSLPTILAPSSLADTGGYILATNSDKTGLEWVAKPTSNVTTSAIVGNSSSATTQISGNQTNPFYNLIEGSSVTRSIQFKGEGTTSVTSDANGVITISSSDSKTGTVTKVSTGIGLTGGDVTTTGTIKAKLKDETKNSADSAKSTSGNGGLYSIEADKSGNLAVRVPWTDTDTKVTSVANHYTPSANADSSLNSTVSSTDNYAVNTEYSVVKAINVQRDAKGHVTGITTTNQKIKDTNTTYSATVATGISLSGTAFSLNVGTKDSTNASSAAEFTSGRFYQVVPDKNNKLGVVVPWQNSWRDIKGNGVSITSDAALNIKPGSGISVSVSGGEITITNSDPNTDTQVTQSESNANQESPVLVKNGTGTDEVTSGVVFADGVTINPSTNSLSISGNLSVSGTASFGNNVTVSGYGVIHSGNISSQNVSYATSAGSVTWSNVTDKPDTATRWPSWSEVTDKPDVITTSNISSYTNTNASVVTISANTSSSCSITGSSNDGKAQTIIYKNSSTTDRTVTVPTTYKTPDGAAIELTCPVGGYCEVSYLNIGGTIYARGL